MSMKITQRNYDLPGDETNGLHHLRLESEEAGVKVTLAERSDGSLSVTIDPLGRDFVAQIETSDVSVNGSQVRLVAKGVAYRA